MKKNDKVRVAFFLLTCFLSQFLFFTLDAINQTADVDTPLFSHNLPFEIEIKKAKVELPAGLHSYAFAVYQGKWLLIAGRTNGMHTFNPNDNFPPQKQNRTVYVIDPASGRTYSRSLEEAYSGLQEWQMDLLSVTSSQFLQVDKTLYIVGGYGVNSFKGTFSTKPFLTAIDIPCLMKWVTHRCHESIEGAFRHLQHPIFQVTGGVMTQITGGPILLLVGQNFKGAYTPASSGVYTKQIRRFKLIDDGQKLKVKTYRSNPFGKDPILRRRDLNIVPIIRKIDGKLCTQLDILAGVFTATDGVWTVPVRVDCCGNYLMEPPLRASTFKQGMNHYACPSLGIYLEKAEEMYTILFGGISYGYFEDGRFLTSNFFPFINQVTAIKLDQDNLYTQYLLNSTYPTILSQQSNAGNPLLFGASAQLIPANSKDQQANGTICFLDEKSKKSHLIGYIVGGIASTLPNTSAASDSFASPYIFEVRVKKQ